MAPARSQQLRRQDPAPAQRYRTERRTKHQGREGGNDDGNRARGGDGNVDDHVNVDKGWDGGGNGSGNGDENKDDHRRKRELANLERGKKRRIGRRERGGDGNEKPATTTARSEPPACPSYHAGNNSPGREVRNRIGVSGGEDKKPKTPQ